MLERHFQRIGVSDVEGACRDQEARSRRRERDEQVRWGLLNPPQGGGAQRQGQQRTWPPPWRPVSAKFPAGSRDWLLHLSPEEKERHQRDQAAREAAQEAVRDVLVEELAALLPHWPELIEEARRQRQRGGGGRD